MRLKGLRGAWLCVALMLAAAALLAACGGSGGSETTGGSEGGETTASSDSPVTIKWLTHNPAETAASESAAEELVAKFNETHPDIEVERESISRDELNTVLKTRLQSDDAPDVFQYGTGPTYAGALAQAGLIYPLDAAYKKYHWSFYPWARKRMQFDGKQTMGIPDQIEALGVYYNKDLFKELGLSVPTTFQEMEATCDKIKEAGKIPMAFGNKDQWPGASMFSMAATATVGRKGVDDILYGNGSWNTPAIVEGIQAVFPEFTEHGCYPESPNGIAYDDANPLFYSEKAAMLPTGSWLTAEVLDAASFEVGFFPFPSNGKMPVALSTGLGDGWYVSAKSKHKEEALEFLNYWFSDEVAKTQLEVFNTIPAFPVNMAGVELSPLFADIVEQINASGDNAGYNLDVITPDKFNQEMYAGFQEVLDGSKSPEQQADALEQSWQDSQSKSAEEG